jgi:hypothetical protein
MRIALIIAMSFSLLTMAAAQSDRDAVPPVKLGSVAFQFLRAGSTGEF